MSLSDLQIERYSRQIVLPEFGGRGQETLLASAVAVLGTGAAARTAASYLAGAGMGRIDLFPGSSESAEAAREIAGELIGLNPEVGARAKRLPDESSPGSWTEPYEAVLSASDSATLRRAGAACHRGALIAGGTIGACGWLWTSRGNPAAPCAVCAERGARQLAAPLSGGEHDSAVAGVIGSLLALAALKRVLGVGSEPRGWWFYDGRRESLVLREECAGECTECGGRGDR